MLGVSNGAAAHFTAPTEDRVIVWQKDVRDIYHAVILECLDTDYLIMVNKSRRYQYKIFSLTDYFLSNLFFSCY